MKILSVKAKVTLWFTLLMSVLVLITFSILFVVGERVAVKGSEDLVVQAVERNINALYFRDGEVRAEDSFYDGVYLTVYDGSGRPLYGQMPIGFSADLSLNDSGVRNIIYDNQTWYVYDVQRELDGFGTVWMRGVMSASGTEAIFSSMMTPVMIILPIFVLLAAIGGYLIVWQAFYPVRKITAAAERIGGGHDLKERIGLKQGKDEIYRLAATFDRMFDRLEASFEKEKQFTSDASHELRTPTAVIIAQSEYALENAKTLEEAKESLTLVLDRAQHMSALISRLLTLSRGDRGTAKLLWETIDLSELMTLVAEQAAEMAEEKAICVSADIEPGIVVNGDETMLLRMMLNLAENGLKYGRHGGELRLKLYRRGDQMIGEVSDNGIGISGNDLPKIWDRFYQVDSVRSDGSGLGLSMVKYIAEAHGGRVSVQSTLGEGSLFRFIIPVK